MLYLQTLACNRVGISQTSKEPIHKQNEEPDALFPRFVWEKVESVSIECVSCQNFVNILCLVLSKP